MVALRRTVSCGVHSFLLLLAAPLGGGAGGVAGFVASSSSSVSSSASPSSSLSMIAAAAAAAAAASKTTALSATRRRHSAGTADNDDDLDAAAPYLSRIDTTSTTVTALTPRQVQAVRKELRHRRAFRTLETVYLSGSPGKDNGNDIDEKESFSGPQSIARLLRLHELVQVRGVAPTDPRLVKITAERLALEVAAELVHGSKEDDSDGDGGSRSSSSSRSNSNSNGNDNVFVVEIKGHAATLYCPHVGPAAAGAGTATNTKSIPLRTTGKDNDWDKRPRAPRDNRGRIIR